jgi:hypothetical protein
MICPGVGVGVFIMEGVDVFIGVDVVIAVAVVVVADFVGVVVVFGETVDPPPPQLIIREIQSMIKEYNNLYIKTLHFFICLHNCFL